MTPKWDFGAAMLPVGALCFYQAHFGRTVLPKWPFWAHLFSSVFYSVSEFRRACFRQARVARAVLPPFRARAFALPPCAPKSHMRPLPHLGVSEFGYGEKIRHGRSKTLRRGLINACSPRTLPYQKYYAVVNLLRVVHLLWHNDLLFPFFCWKKAGKTTKKQWIFYPYRSPKIPGKGGKMLKKTKGILARNQK